MNWIFKTAQVFVFATAAVFGTIDVSSARTLSQFLEALDGKWRGSGVVKYGVEGGALKVKCAFKFSHDAQRRVLTNSGKCVTTKGKQNTRGKINYKANGKNLSGTFISSQNIKVTQSYGRYTGSKIILNSTFLSDAQLTKAKTVVVLKSKKSFYVDLYEFGKKQKKYIKLGRLSFRR